MRVVCLGVGISMGESCVSMCVSVLHTWGLELQMVVSHTNKVLGTEL